LKKQHERIGFVERIGKDNEQAWENNGVVYMERRIYIPNNQKI